MSVAVVPPPSRRQGPHRPTSVAAPPASAFPVPTDEGGRPTAAGVAEAVTTLREALDAGGERWTPDVADAARTGLADLERRLALGLDRTVVALVGGTGSGKSSLVNAIAGLAFAEVGELRPTTAQPSACLWGGPADTLLDALGVPPERRTRRESPLDADREDALRGLVLLDLPDTDSVETGHAADVDRILPLVDLLVWVVDPQKYADSVLHERYLQAFAGRRDATVVLVNQTDTVTPAAVDRIAADVARLLAADGLAGVPVVGTSAATGAGIAQVRALLTRVVAAGSARLWLAAREAATLAALLAEDCGHAPARSDGSLGAAAGAAASVLTDATGVRAAAASLASAVVRGRADDAPGLGAPSPAAAASARDLVVEAGGRGLRRRWRTAVAAAAGDATRLWTAAGDAIATLERPAITAGRAWRAAAVAVGLLGLAGAVVGAVSGAVVLAVGAGLGGIALVAALLAAERAARRRAARVRAEALEADVRAALADVVNRVLVAPVVAVRSERAAIHARLAGVPDLLRG